MNDPVLIVLLITDVMIFLLGVFIFYALTRK